jgi:hypothetical protein
MAPEQQATAQQDPHRLNRTNDDPSIMGSCLSRFDFVVIDEHARIIRKGDRLAFRIARCSLGLPCLPAITFW